MEEAPARVTERLRFVGRLKVYRDRLLHVDFRNRSIFLKRVQKKWGFDLGLLNRFAPGVGLEVVRKSLAGKGSVCLVRDADLTEGAVEFRSGLAQLERSARLTFEETGLQDTYLGFPFLVGSVDELRMVRAPLVLFPIKLEHQRRERAPGWYVESPAEASPIFNRALAGALRKTLGINIPEEFQEKLETITEQAASDDLDPISAFLDGIAHSLLAMSFPLEARALDSSNLAVLQPILSADIPTLPKSHLHIEQLAVIGSFPQASSAIYQDYETLIERAVAGEHDQGVIDDLLEAPFDKPRPEQGDDPVDLDKIPDREMNFALETDGSQDAVIAEAQREECVVVRGPPGTGKSQVIVNLITNALAKGETILVVCQKRAALDVVFQRLERVGLTQAAVLLHDSRADRPGLYRTLARRIVGLSGSEDSRLDREFLEASGSIDKTIREINAIVKPMQEEYFGGIKLLELYLAADPEFRPKMNLGIRAEQVSYPDLRRLLERLPRLEEGYLEFDVKKFALHGRIRFARLQADARDRIANALDRVVECTRLRSLVLRNRVVQQGLVDTIPEYQRLRGAALRFFRPRWRRSERVLENFLRSSGKTIDSIDLDALREALITGSSLLQSIDDLSEWFQPEAVEGFRLLATKRSDLASFMLAAKTALEQFDAIQEYDRLVAGLNGSEAELLRYCVSNFGEATDTWAPPLKQEVIALWISEVEKRNPTLAGDPLRRYLDLRGKLDALLVRRRVLFTNRLSHQLEDRSRIPILPPGNHHHRRSPQTDWTKLSHEFSKQRRVKPVRRLVEEFPFQIMRIAPCWLISPEAASDVFPLTRGLFDLVVFDEASQLAVERSLPAVYRAKRVVIAGDEKQLRPFDLFRLQDDEDELNEDDIIETESLLVLAKRTFPPRYLSWHYRSRFQELINFSNHAFYEGNLQIAANVQKAVDRAPITFLRCPGVWEDRKNIVEAERVVDLIHQILQEGEGSRETPTIGVITFNESQRNQILDSIESRRSSHEIFDRLYSLADSESQNLDDRPFVKNIENVQGDERDIIIFSVGYGPDPDGRLRVQFGLLNQEGGENRLNVAVTRARRGVFILASFDPAELPVESTKNLGPKRLKEYLLYAQAVSEKNREETQRLLSRLNPDLAPEREAPSPLVFESPLEVQVHDALQRMGYEIDAQVGFSGYRIDLAVVNPKDPTQYVLGIECDGAMFHSARSARERDVTRQRYLESRGWKVDRVWSRNWWRNRGAELERLKTRIDSLS